MQHEESRKCLALFVQGLDGTQLRNLTAMRAALHSPVFHDSLTSLTQVREDAR